MSPFETSTQTGILNTELDSQGLRELGSAPPAARNRADGTGGKVPSLGSEAKQWFPVLPSLLPQRKMLVGNLVRVAFNPCT